MVESASLKTYFKDIRKLDLTESAEQTKLAIKAKKGDKKALNKLVESNLRFVISVAREYPNSGIPLEDLINEGNYGLIKAVKKFDKKKGYKFISYAVWWIRQAMLQCIYENSSIVRIPINRVNNGIKINKAKDNFLKKLNREPTTEELATILNFTEKHIDSYESDSNFTVSLDKCIEGEESFTLCDKIESDSFDEMESKMNAPTFKSDIDSVLEELTPREKKIIKLYFGIDVIKELTLKEIGEKMNLTNERVRQIKDFALKKLRMYGTSSKLREYLNKI